MIKDEFAVVDVETTGLNPYKNEILEVCAIIFDYSGNVIKKFYQLCSPVSGSIPIEASNINGITMEKVANCPAYLEIRQNLGDFIGKRLLVGHNLIDFDIKFLKIRPIEVQDTLLMSRKRWPKQKNNLEEACKRAKIPFNKEEAHSAEYDVLKCGLLYLALLNMDNENLVQPESFLKDIEKAQPTQTYSFSRIKLFNTCPYKWKQIYLLKQKEPDSPHLVVGRVVHNICEMSALWCYAETFANKFEVYARANDMDTMIGDLVELIKTDITKNRPFYLPNNTDDINNKVVGMFLFRNPGYIKKFYGKTITDLINIMNQAIPETEYENISMPNMAVYNKLIQVALVSERCKDPELIKDVQYLASWFYNQRNFSMYTGEMALVEKRLIFDKNWKLLNDWFSDEGYMRGIIDVLEYNIDYVTLLDYKTGRKMLTEQELKNDPQMKVYVLLVWEYLPQDKINKIVVKHHYVRFGKTIEYVVEDPKSIAEEAKQWIEMSIHEIEKEMLKPDKDSFKPRRNEYCHSCFLANDNKCPLFDVKKINDISDPKSFEVRTMDDLRQAWKKVEVNKMENLNLTKKCKDFVKSCTERAKIDELATLDFWVKENENYKTAETIKKILNKDIKLSQILPFFNITAANMEKLQKRLKIEFTEEEIKEITEIRTKTEFDAFTDKEAESKQFINK